MMTGGPSPPRLVRALEEFRRDGAAGPSAALCCALLSSPAAARAPVFCSRAQALGLPRGGLQFYISTTKLAPSIHAGADMDQNFRKSTPDVRKFKNGRKPHPRASFSFSLARVLQLKKETCTFDLLGQTLFLDMSAAKMHNASWIPIEKSKIPISNVPLEFPGV
jgi:hypothetical protein